MNGEGKKVEIPEKYAGLVKSAVQTRFGWQERPYGPHVYEFHVRAADPDRGEAARKDITEFCQECCMRCKNGSGKYAAAMSDETLSFDQQMAMVAEGRYTLDYYNGVWMYVITQDYID